MHERFDPLQHDIEVLGEPVEFVAGAGDRQAAGEIAIHDVAGGVGHGIDPLEHAARDEKSARDTKHHNDRQRPPAGGEHDIVKPLTLFQIASDQEPKTAGQLKHPHQGAMPGTLRIFEPAIDAFGPARPVENASGQRADIAGEPFPRRGGNEVEARARPPRPEIDDEDEASDAALAVLLRQPGDLGIDRLGDLLGDQAPGIPGEIAEQERREQRKDRQVDQRQLERGRAQTASPSAVLPPPFSLLSAGPENHLASRMTYPAPRTVCSNAWVKPLSIFERSREMCTSMTLVCGSK